MPPSRISEESRLAVLRLVALLDTPAEEAFDRLTRLAARATGAPVAAVTLLDETRQLFKSAVGLAGPAAARREVPRADSLCDHVVRTGEALVACDTRAHPATRGRAGVRTLGWAAYLGVPLATPDGAVLGAFCLADHRPREWSEGELETARDLAAAVVTEIELRREAREAAGALAGLREAREALERREQFYRALLENASDVVDVVDPDGTIRYITPSVERLLGYSPAEMVGTVSTTYLAEPPAPVRERLAGRAAAPGRGEPVLLRMKARDGAVRIFEAQTTNLMEHPAVRGLVVNARDVTERRRTEEALRLRDRALDAAPQGVIITGPAEDDFPILYANPGFLRLTGYAEEEVLGRNCRFLSGPATHPETVEAMRAALAEGRDCSVEVVNHRKDGTPFWNAVSFSPVRDEWGRITHFVGVQADVTERRRAEAELRESEERFRLLVDAVRDHAIFLLDPDGLVASWNAGAERVLGYPAEEVLGRPLSVFYPAGGREELPARDLREAVEEGRSEHDGWWVRRGGELAWMNTVLSPMRDDAGRLVGFAALARDLTERRAAEEALRRSEALLRSVVEGVSDAIFLKDLDGRYRLVNSAGARNAGLAPDDFTGRTDRELFPAVADEVERVERRVLETGEAQSHERIHERGGKTRVYVMTRAPFRGPDGRIAGILGMAHDVTERRLLEEQLRQSQKMEAVGRLAGGVAHDFNNLLMAIGGHAQLLLRRIDGESPLRRSLEEIHRATGRAAALTQQLLAFSRQQVLQPRVVEPGAVVRELRPMLERLIGEDVELVIRDGARGRVRADPAQLEQVLLNLAVNARDAMPLGGVLVIETSDAVLGPADAERYRYVTPGRFVLLTVTDTGEGMDEATRDRAFEPFFTTKPPGKGTGLGLATVYGVVKQSGGYVWIDSTPGKATTFRIYLPRVDGPATPASPLAAAPEPAGPAASGTVLLVEDDDAVRALAAEALESGGFTVLSAPDGPAALALAGDAAVDLLLTDVVMPGMAGPELARRLRERRPALAVLFMSGYPGEEVLRRGTSVEGAGFVQKPADPAELVRRAARAVEARRRGEG